MASAEGGFTTRGLVATTTWKRIGEGGMEALEEELKTHPETRMVIVDTLQKIRRRGGSSKDKYADDYEALGALKQVADKYGVAVVVIHHTRKGRGEDPLEEVSGTFGITGAADSILVAKRERGQHDATLFLTGRDVEERTLSLRWDKRYCLWSILGDAEEFSLSDERREIVELLQESAPIRMSPKEVAESLGKTPGTVRWMMSDMARKDQILGDSDGNYTVIST
jgi:DNA-binding Lrp family transcriptional regulator